VDEELERIRGELGYDSAGDIESGDGDDDQPVSWREVLHILAEGRTDEAERLATLPAPAVMKMIVVKARYNQRLLKKMKSTTGNIDLEHLREHLV
jgi:hypothetical protein